MRIIAILATLLGSTLLSTPSWALFDNYGLDATYCQQPTVRSTVVYIDDMMMADGQTEWATKLGVKLRATLTPGERVTVVRLSPGSGQSKEYWSGCWPDYPAAKKAALAQRDLHPATEPGGQDRRPEEVFHARLRRRADPDLPGCQAAARRCAGRGRQAPAEADPARPGLR